MATFLAPPPGNSPVVITNDGGGLVNKYFEQAYAYRIQGRRVEIRGSCRSACVLALSVPDVCVSPGAVVKAHQAYEEWTGKLRPDYTEAMLDRLPPKIKTALSGKIQRNYTADSILTYDELRALGVADCGKQKVVVKSDSSLNIGRPTLKILNPIEAILRVFK
jgi:hypothetical protein